MAAIDAVASLASCQPRVAEPTTLEFLDISKNYGGLRAVDGVSGVAQPGQVLGIAGPNGAGKTTLFDVLSGITPASSGAVSIGGAPLDGLGVHKRCHLGLARTFQQPTVSDDLSVRENVDVAIHFGNSAQHWTGYSGGPADRSDWVLDWCGLGAKSETRASILGVFDKKRLMLGTAVALGPRALLLDEPFGGLNPSEVEEMLALTQKAVQSGIAVVCIEHVMKALVRLADRVLVMNHGSMLFEGSPQEMLRDQDVIAVYLGTDQHSRGDEDD